MKLKNLKLITLFYLLMLGCIGQTQEMAYANVKNAVDNHVLESKTGKSVHKNNSDDNGEVRYIGEEYMGGVIFHVYTDDQEQQHGLIVSVTETTTKWQNKGEITEADKFNNGAYNMNLMTDSPAKDWITENFSWEWYLPSIDELSLLWENYTDVNRTLRVNSNPLISANGNYWSSTESTKANAFGFNFSRLGNRFSRNKANSYNIRAIRTF